MIRKSIIILTLVLVFVAGTGNAADNVFDDNVVIGASSASDKLHVEGGGMLQKISSAPVIEGCVIDATILSGAHAVYVSGRYAYVSSPWGNYFSIIDIAEPASPTIVGSLQNATQLDYIRSVYVAGNYAYVGAQDDNRLVVIDVSDSSSPTISGSVQDNTDLNQPRSVYVSGPYAYVACYIGDSLTVVDISDPVNPAVVGSVADGTVLNSAYSVFVSGEYAYVSALSARRLVAVDISDPTSPAIADDIYDATLLNGAASIYVSGKYAYVPGLLSNYLTIVDVSDPNDLTIAGSVQDAVELNEPISVYVSGKYAYVASRAGDTLTIVDVSDPTSPSVVDSVTHATQLNGAQSVYVSGKYAYVVAYNGNCLTIVDIFGIDASSASIGDISASTIYVDDDMDVGNNVYVRSGLNVGPGGIMAGGELAVGGESYFGDKVGINEDDPSYDLSVAGTFGIRETTGATYYSIFQGGNQTADITYALPAADGSAGQLLSTNGSDTLSWVASSGTSPSGSADQTLRHNGSAWVANSILVNDGTNIGIGDATPAALLTVGSGDLFQVNSSGVIASAAGITSSGTITFSGLSTDGPVITASGVLSSEDLLAISRGGTNYLFSNINTGCIPRFISTGTMNHLPYTTSGYELTTQGAGANVLWAASSNTTGPTLVVAASDSSDTTRADASYVCNGSDDEVEIEAAIAALPSGGGTIKLLEGTYVVEACINITESNISLIGSGKSTILERNWDAVDGPTGCIISVGNGGTAQVSGVVIANLAIDGQKDTYEGTYNIGIGFYYDVSQTRIENNLIYDCDGEGMNLYGGSGGNENLYNFIIGNDIRDNDEAGVYINYGDYFVIADNVFKTNGINGLHLVYSDYCTATNNIIDDNERRGIYICDSDFTSVTGNVVSNTDDTSANGYGICLYEANYNTISGNVSSNNAEYGLMLENADYNVMVGNNFYNNGESDCSSTYIGGTSSDNIFSSNLITDTAGSGVYAIVLGSSAQRNYLMGNRYSGTGATSIYDWNTANDRNIIQHWNEFEIDGTFQACEFLTEAQNSGVTLTSSDFGKTITIDSSSTQTVSLPSVTSGDEGAWFRVIKLNTGQVTIDAADSDTIADSTAGGTIYNSQSAEDYATITIQLANSTEWVVTKAHGTWVTN